MIRYNTSGLDDREKSKLLSNTYTRFKFDTENDVMEDLIIELAAEVKMYRKTIDSTRKILAEERKNKENKKSGDLYFTINNFYGNDAGGDDV